MQIEFLRDRERSVVGQKVDSLPSMQVSTTSVQPHPIAFGRLVVFDDTDAFLCKPPTTPAHLEKPLGITVRQLHGEDYQPKSSILAMRKGRIWIEAEKVEAPGDAVYIKLNVDGSHAFTGSKTDNTPLKGAIFLEKSEGGKVPIEVILWRCRMSFSPQSVFLKQQPNHILNLAFEESFPALKARSFVPVNRWVPQAAETVSTRIWDAYGEAKVLNAGADDFPSVSIGQREAFAAIKSLGCYFEYSVLDLRRSELAGTGLDAKLAVAARQTIESKIDKLAVNGDERFGIKGVCNHEGIEKHSLTKWFDDKGKALKTAEQMLGDINQMISVIAENTNNVLLPDTLLLPVKHYSYLAQTPFSSLSQVTILNYLLSNNPYLKNIDWWVHLKDRCIIYPRTPQALEMYLPLEFEMLEPQSVGMNIRIHCHARFGGVQVYTPKACAYGVGL